MSPATAPAAPITPEQFLELPDRDRYELVGGELVELPVMSMEGSAIAALLAWLLNNFVRPSNLGVVYDSEASYCCFPHDPDQVRRPDLSFISRGRLAQQEYKRGHCSIAPDLAVEIVSPNDSLAEMGVKIEQYLEAGVRLVWLINPLSRTAEEYRADGPTDHIRRGGTLSAEPVLPGLSIPLEVLLQDLNEPA